MPLIRKEELHISVYCFYRRLSNVVIVVIACGATACRMRQAITIIQQLLSLPKLSLQVIHHCGAHQDTKQCREVGSRV